ncbi:MAG: GTP cyclohydrolase I, partial [Acidobacteriota bacterium]|nr:GTP cyclohydrolase I [Acidobacteriota bacterium]
TKQVADIIMDHLDPLGVIVVIEAEHMCVSMRGAKKPKSVAVTSAVRGLFRSRSVIRLEAISLIRGGFSSGKEV